MPQSPHRSLRASFTILAFSLLFTACGQTQTSGPDESGDLPSQLPDESTSTTQTPADIYTPDSPPPSDGYLIAPGGALSPSGPWFVFSGVGSLWAVNHDGSGLTQIDSHLIQWNREWLSGIAPTGGRLAYITGEDDFNGLQLYLYSFADGESHLITDLVAPGLEPTAGERVEAVEAISYGDALAWSPDGSKLAFISAVDGPSSDLYLYTLTDDSITRLTDGDSQTHRLDWSPDGRYILHFGVRTFGTGAGYSMAGAWAAAADNSAIINLYQPSSGDEIIVGWWDALTALVHSWDAGCGNGRLRTLDILSGVQDSLWDAYIGPLAMDPASGAIVLTIPSRIARCDSTSQQGIYYIAKNGVPVRILEDDPSDVIWSPTAHLFFARTEFGVVAISTLGDWVQLETLSGFFPAANPTDKSLAWYGGDGLWLSPLRVSIDGPQPEKVFDAGVTFASWDPGGEYLFFLTENGAFVLRLADRQIFDVGGETGDRRGGWVLP